MKHGMLVLSVSYALVTGCDAGTVTSSLQTTDAASAADGDGNVGDASDGDGNDAEGAHADGGGERDEGGEGDGIDGPDGGGHDRGGHDSVDAGSKPQGKPVFVAVGYQGRRVRSVDLGKTWTDEAPLEGGGDDVNLLRAVTFARGRFVAVGFELWTSADGTNWQPQNAPHSEWAGGIQFGNGRFVSAGGYGTSAYSTDGLTWQTGGAVGSGERTRSVAFGNGKFMAATDAGNGHWWSSTDGESWTFVSGGHSAAIAFCNGQFRDYADCTGTFASRERAFGAGVHVRVSANDLERSEDGVDFTKTLARAGVESVAFGYVK